MFVSRSDSVVGRNPMEPKEEKKNTRYLVLTCENAVGPDTRRRKEENQTFQEPVGFYHQDADSFFCCKQIADFLGPLFSDIEIVLFVSNKPCLNWNGNSNLFSSNPSQKEAISFAAERSLNLVGVWNIKTHSKKDGSIGFGIHRSNERFSSVIEQSWIRFDVDSPKEIEQTFIEWVLPKELDQDILKAMKAVIQ